MSPFSASLAKDGPVIVAADAAARRPDRCRMPSRQGCGVAPGTVRLKEIGLEIALLNFWGVLSRAEGEAAETGGTRGKRGAA